jgi:signal transduction histidine kinase
MDAQQTSVFIVILIVSITVGAIITYFIVSLIRHHKRNVELYKSKMLAEITTLESERKRMAADLHDELGPIVAGIKLKLNSLDVHEKQDQITLENVHGNINELIGRMREISNDLMPGILLKKGLIEALEVSIGEINRSKQFNIQFTHGDIPVLQEHKAINLYRIMQEIIHNTIKHAGATELMIEINMNKSRLIVITRDNGSGFNYTTESKEHSGLGLQNLLSRTEALEGNMYVDSSESKGTAYTFEIPI